MKKVTHKLYKDYPNQPYISPDRDLAKWEEYPETFPYSKVEIKQMETVEDDLLPGDIIMLWRISLNTFTNETEFPNYFEYKYGINGDESLQKLFDKGYARVCSASESLESVSMVVLKRIFKHRKLSTTGKKQDLIQRALGNIPEEELAKEFNLRIYRITHEGNALLDKHFDIVKKHGPKM